MLADNYRIFESIANSYIPDWEQISKNDLFNKYVENENINPEVAEAYFSAIVCRYWGRIKSLYFNSQPVFKEEDCYDWLINAIIYTLKNRKWLDPACSLHKDKNGPDKALNICIKSERLTAYQASNRYKRKGNALTVSLERQLEEYGDYYTPSNLTCSLEDNFSYDYIVTDAFSVKDYFKAFMVDIILYDNVFQRTLDGTNNVMVEFSRKKLIHYLRTLDLKYFKYFEEKYHIPLEKILKAYSYISNLSTDSYITKIKRVKRDLRKYLKELA